VPAAQYIRDFIRLDESTKTARELYDRMLELYPNRVGNCRVQVCDLGGRETLAFSSGDFL
jgi:hypothetical protein